MLKDARHIAWVAVLAVSLIGSAGAVGAAISPPEDGHFVVDLAQLLESEDIATINALCDESQTQRGIPFYVVTIESMAAHGASDSAIDSFAWDLFEQWGVNPDFSASPNWRQGILFLVSKDDRKARIELGMDWDVAFTARSIEIMEEVIVPAFKTGDYTSGIVEGVRALATMDPSTPPDAPTAADTSPLYTFFWMSALMIAGFALLYGLLIFAASKLTKPLVPFPQRDYAKEAAFGATTVAHGGNTDTMDILSDPARRYENSGGHIGFSPDYFDTSSSSFSTPDNGGSFSDGGGASGSW